MTKVHNICGCSPAVTGEMETLPCLEQGRHRQLLPITSIMVSGCAWCLVPTLHIHILVFLSASQCLTQHSAG